MRSLTRRQSGLVMLIVSFLSHNSNQTYPRETLGVRKERYATETRGDVCRVRQTWL